MSPFRDPNKKGIALMTKGQYEMAIEEFKSILVKDPRNWAFLFIYHLILFIIFIVKMV